MARSEEIRIELSGGGQVRGLLSLPGAELGASPALGLVLAHGLRTGIEAPDMRAASRAAVAAGAAVLRFRFPFREAGRSQADPQPQLADAYRAAAATLRSRLGLRGDELVLGGRSLGARVASLTAAAGEPAAGLLLLAYPLHLPGRFGELRDTQLYVVNRPMLFVSGSRDEYCRLDLLWPVLHRLGRQSTLEVLEGADHGFCPEGGPRVALQSHLDQLAGALRRWLATIMPRRSG